MEELLRSIQPDFASKEMVEAEIENTLHVLNWSKQKTNFQICSNKCKIRTPLRIITTKYNETLSISKYTEKRKINGKLLKMLCSAICKRIW